MAAMLRDRLDQRDRARTLEVLTERFNLATREAQVGVWERWNTSGKVWWSEVMYQIFGQDPASFQPSHEAWDMAIHPDDRNQSAVLGARRATTLRYRIVRPDGNIRHVESIGGTESTGQSTSGILRDVTAQVEAERREEALQRQLRESSHRAGMAEIAIGVLHNVGNVLNSLGVANTTLSQGMKTLRVEQLRQTSALIHDHRATLAAFLADDERGRHLPDYLKALSAQIAADVGTAREEVETMAQLLQILVNLITNARDAVHAGSAGPRRIILRLFRDADHAMVSVEDSGVGMSGEVISRLWQFGFSTKPGGNGFGLHNSANAARELGATITAHSDGPGKGSLFVVRLPLR
jgi:signal transduction histidine kinase